MKTVSESLLLLWPVLCCLDQGLDKEGVLGDPRGHRQDTLGDSHLPQQGVVGALLHKLLEPPVRLEDVFVDGHGVRVLGAEGPICRLPPYDVLFAAELVHEDVGDGGDDRSGVLALSQLPQELKVNADKGVELWEQAVQQLGLHVQVGGHPLAEHLLDHLEQLAVMLLRDNELVHMLLPLGFVLL